MSAGRLARLVVWDVRVQARERIYVFTAVTTGLFCLAVMLLPAGAPATIVTGILFLDPAVVGGMFVGGLVLLERSQHTPPALAVTPASPADYVVAKLFTFTALTVAGGLVIVAVSHWPPRPRCCCEWRWR
jgi:fluoroquinolone transport system permease protein